MANCLAKLLGRCCCECDCGGEGDWQERRVVAVSGRTAYTTHGPVRLSVGNNPRPGGVVVVSGTLAAGSTPQQRPGGLRRDDPLFVPQPSYDSPQRPGAWSLEDSAGPS